MITLKGATESSELEGILRLQNINLERNISEKESKNQGFVTVNHDLSTLAEISGDFHHIIAKNAEEVVGYALVMLSEFNQALPVLIPMFEMVDQTTYEGKLLGASSYFVMGQICIAKAFRSKGIFEQLYEALCLQMEKDFDYIITEVADRNQRSLNAHYRVGFKTIKKYTAPNQEVWHLILKPCKTA